jgi:molybdate transport system substrate-binding protein
MNYARYCCAGSAALVIAAASTVVFTALPSMAAELSIVSGSATAGLLSELGPQFEQRTGHKLVFYKGVGTTAGVKQRIESGEPFDLAIIPTDLIDEFVRQGRIAVDTHIPFVRVGMAVATRVGARKPDISSLEAFKRALLEAKAITYVPGGEVAVQLERAIERLDIAEQLKSKSKPQANGALSTKLVVNGEADLFFSLTNTIATSRGLDLVGTFPPELQRYLVLGIGVSASAREPNAANEFLTFLLSETAAAVVRVKGLEAAPR